MRSKRIRRQIYDDPNRWLLSYADFITLLFAFFVVMYAMSSVNLHKYKAVASSVGYAFDSKMKTKQQLSHHSYLKTNPTKLQSFQSDNNEMKQKQNKQFKALNSSLLTLDNHLYKVRAYDGWYEIEIKSSSLFDSGQADLSKSAIKELKKLAIKLKSVKGIITVEGYTDILPIHTNRYGSNWALSSARAAIVAQIIDEEGLASKQISAVGYASQFPVASNRTQVGREKNRRVVIVVAKDGHSQRLLNPIKSEPVLGQEAIKRKKNTISIKRMKEVKTKDGGIIFTQSVEDKEILTTKPTLETQNEETPL